MESEMIEENKPSGLIVSAAILHILDYSNGMSLMSMRTLNLEDRLVEKYVKRHVKKIHDDIRNRKGFFKEESKILQCLKERDDSRCSLTEFSEKAIEPIDSFLKNTALLSYDVLFADYTMDDVPFTAVLLLENQLAYMHETKEENGTIYNSVTQRNALLPSPTKKLSTFARINRITKEIEYTDETNWDQGDVQVMQDVILQCTSEKSREEVLETVNAITNDIAEQYDENPTILLSKVKHFIRESVLEDKPVSPEELAEQVFEDEPEMKETFRQKSIQAELPREMEVPRAVTTRSMKNQKIRTDTGIELSFPTEYFSNPDYIEFVTQPDGTISITIRHIGKIINRK